MPDKPANKFQRLSQGVAMRRISREEMDRQLGRAAPIPEALPDPVEAEKVEDPPLEGPALTKPQTDGGPPPIVTLEPVEPLPAEPPPLPPEAPKVPEETATPLPSNEQLAVVALMAFVTTRDNRITFGKLVREKLRARGMTQREASDRMGYANRGQFGNLLDARGAAWSEARMQKLLKVLEVSAPEMLAGLFPPI